MVDSLTRKIIAFMFITLMFGQFKLLQASGGDVQGVVDVYLVMLILAYVYAFLEVIAGLVEQIVSLYHEKVGGGA